MIRSIRVAVLMACLGTSVDAVAASCGVDGAQHPCRAADDARGRCLDAVQRDPADRSARLTLCAILLDGGELDAAAAIVREGLAKCADDSACQDDLLLAGSIVSEALASRDRADPLADERQRLAQDRRCRSRLTTDQTVAACEALILEQPGDLSLYKSLASKRLKRGEPTDALKVLLTARSATGDPGALASLVREALAQREPLVEKCLGSTSRRECEEIFIAGADDAPQIQARLAKLNAPPVQRVTRTEPAISARDNGKETPGIDQQPAVAEQKPPARNAIDSDGVVH